MTIAISLKVNDGVVLASDSASTIISTNDQGEQTVSYIYDNANKIFNLKKGLPIGAITWGSGSIGQSSISTLAKDFRSEIDKRIPGIAQKRPEYSIEEIAKEFKKFIFDEKYVDAFKDWAKKPDLGFMIVGYSSGQPLAEEWKLDIIDGKCTDPYIVRKQPESGITWNGVPEVIFRIILGYSTQLIQILKAAKIEDSKIEEVVKLMTANLQFSLLSAPMPVQDVIDLANSLVQTTIDIHKFLPGASTVRGPIEIAAITKYEGFKWIKRKHYFDVQLNLGELHT